MNVKSNTYTATFPWGHGTRVPPENLADEVDVRSLSKSFNDIALSHIRCQDVDNIGNGFSIDHDPDPHRILRTREFDGKKFVLEVTSSSNGVISPTSLVYKSVSGSNLAQSVKWKEGTNTIVSLSQNLPNEDGQDVLTSFTVNDNGTLTYSRTTPE